MSNLNRAFQKIEDKIIMLLEEGHIPWQKPFDLKTAPMNPVSNVDYSGFNAWILSLGQYNSIFFCGFQQVKKLGDDAKVKKGESGWPIMYPYFKYFDKETGNQLTKKDARKLGTEEVTKKVLYGYSHVWNIEQCVNIDRNRLPDISNQPVIDFKPIDRCEAIVDNWENKPKIIREGGRALYNRKKDEVVLPETQYFNCEEEGYAILFHELIHATGSSERLGRAKGKYFGDKAYCFEELIAEFGAAFLCGYAGIEKPVIENKSAYINNWLQAIREKDDGEEWIVSACSKAREAAEYILGDQQEMLKKVS